MTERVRPVEPQRTSLMPGEIAAFSDLSGKGIFDKKLPQGFHTLNWLGAPTSALKGVGPATQQLLASKGINTVRQVALSRAMWQREFPAAAKVLANAKTEIQAACEKYRVSLGGEPAGPISTTMARYFDPVTGRHYNR